MYVASRVTNNEHYISMQHLSQRLRRSSNQDPKALENFCTSFVLRPNSSPPEGELSHEHRQHREAYRKTEVHPHPPMAASVVTSFCEMFVCYVFLGHP